MSDGICNPSGVHFIEITGAVLPVHRPGQLSQPLIEPTRQPQFLGARIEDGIPIFFKNQIMKFRMSAFM
ncbi:MAG TPA: hypothetical protein DCG48_07515 [Rhodospirillaceae bacterium]|nr:hypothetical protein [Rhodospirillaceae bacterium]